MDIGSTISRPYGLFEYLGEIYIVNLTGEVYNISTTSPYNLTLTDTVLLDIFGASQSPTNAISDFDPNT